MHSPAHWLRHGTVVDGTGAPAVVADVLLVGDRIAAIGSACAAAAAALPTPPQQHDCTGLTITPGFIDVHTHDDAMVLQQPGMRPKLSQGITTVVTGNCGISLLPLATSTPSLMLPCS